MYQMDLFDWVNHREKYVRQITYNEAKPFIMEIHYARRMPCIQYAFGLFMGGY